MYTIVTILSSSVVEPSAVNRFVVGSNPTWGEKLKIFSTLLQHNIVKLKCETAVFWHEHCQHYYFFSPHDIANTCAGEIVQRGDFKVDCTGVCNVRVYNSNV